MTTLLRSECRAVGRHCDSERQPFLCSGPAAAAVSGAGLSSILTYLMGDRKVENNCGHRKPRYKI